MILIGVAQEIGTFRMMCTGYDTEFVRILQRNAHMFVPPPPKPKNRKPKQERDTSTSGTKRKVGNNAAAKDRAETKRESDEDDARVHPNASMTTTRANAKRRKLA